MKRAVSAKRVRQLRRRENDLRHFRLARVGDRQRPIAVIGLSAEKTAQSHMVIKWILDIEPLQPLCIQSDKLDGNRKILCPDNGVHRSLTKKISGTWAVFKVHRRWRT